MSLVKGENETLKRTDSPPSEGRGESGGGGDGDVRWCGAPGVPSGGAPSAGGESAGRRGGSRGGSARG